MLVFGFRLFRKIQGDSAAWVWAMFLFALSYTHGVPAGWLANRNAVLAVLFVILTLSSHHRWREGNRSPLDFRSSIFFALGLLCGEMAGEGIMWVTQETGTRNNRPQQSNA